MTGISEITEEEIRQKISQYLKSNKMRQKDFAEEMGFTATTFSKMMNGSQRFTKKNIKAAMFMMGSPNLCYLEHCPALPPVDRFLQVILEAWEALSPKDRAQVAGLASEIAENKKGSSRRDGESSTEKVG